MTTKTYDAVPSIVEAVREGAQVRAHDRVSRVDHYDAIAAVNFYAEVFVAGA